GDYVSSGTTTLVVKTGGTNCFQCCPIGNMLKTIDFIGDLKIGWRFNRHTPSHSSRSRQKAFIFDYFHAFPVVWLCNILRESWGIYSLILNSLIALELSGLCTSNV